MITSLRAAASVAAEPHRELDFWLGDWEVFADGKLDGMDRIPLHDGHTLLDQTTLTPLADGTVHQVIAQSAGRGNTWKVDYDAIYRRISTEPSAR